MIDDLDAVRWRIDRPGKNARRHLVPRTERCGAAGGAPVRQWAHRRDGDQRSDETHQRAACMGLGLEGSGWGNRRSATTRWSNFVPANSGGDRSEKPNGMLSPRFEDVAPLDRLAAAIVTGSSTSRRHHSVAAFSQPRTAAGSHLLQGGGEDVRTWRREIWSRRTPGDAPHVLRNGAPIEAGTCSNPLAIRERPWRTAVR